MIVKNTDPRIGKINIHQLYEAILDEILLDVLANKKTLAYLFTIGSRFSGKTHAILMFFMKCFLATADKGQHIFYIVRKKEKQLNAMKAQLFKDLYKEFGFQVTSGVGKDKNFKGGAQNYLKYKDNYINFVTLNDEKVKVEDGGVTGGTTWGDAKYIFIFGEEMSQIKRPIWDQFLDTVRGNQDTQKIILCASNPWSPHHWYIKMCLQYLPEDKLLMAKEGYQHTQTRFMDGEQAVFIRNNLLTNPYIPLPQLKKIESYITYNKNAYDICYLGLCGVLEATLYSASYLKMLPIDWVFVNSKHIGELHIGIDWGEGKSRNASPTTMHFARVHDTYGVAVIGEYTHWNNGNGDDIAPMALSTVEQFDKMIDQIYIWWQKFEMPIAMFIDTGATIDFQDLFNDRIVSRGYSLHQFRAYPADKEIPIEERVLTTNVLLAKGLYRIDPIACPNLDISLRTARQIEADDPKEEDKFKRDPTTAHWLNSGAEYILDHYSQVLSRGWSEMYESRKDD